jgi:hypothetical protein
MTLEEAIDLYLHLYGTREGSVEDAKEALKMIVEIAAREGVKMGRFRSVDGKEN